MALAGGVQLCATAGLKYEVLTESPIHVVYDREAPVVVSLASNESRLLKGTLFAEDYFGNQVGTTVDCKVVSNETVCIRLPPMKRYGAYVVKSDLEGSRKDVTRFAVLPQREWTMPLADSKFAMGTQDQLPWYSAEDQAKVIESARLMGSKVVRLNFCSFSRVCKNSPEPDWTEADRYMQILETKGMRIDANIYGFPQWAQKKPGMAAPADGTFTGVKKIRDLVQEGDVVGYVAGVPMRATISGVLRGLLANGVEVKQGMKSGDIDPRGEVSYCDTVSDKANAVAGGVLEAIFHLGGALREKENGGETK